MKYPKTAISPETGVEYWAQEPLASGQGSWRIVYRNLAKYGGFLILPEGWQDMDRTWTSQDIYWQDKYDERNVRSGATLDILNSLLMAKENNIIKVLEHETREQTLHLWGQPEIGSHCLIEAKHGDGMQVVCFQTMDSRPFQYLIRVDSYLDLDLDDYELLNEEDQSNYGCFSEMIMQMIEEEYDNLDRYEETEGGLYTNDQDIEEGHEPFEYKFPMFSLGAGYSYGVVDIQKR